MAAVEAQALASSSIMSAQAMVSSPIPPCALGIVTPSIPALARLSMACRGKRCWRSISAALGAISRARQVAGLVAKGLLCIRQV
jgi:hypothetical protein